MGLVQPTYLFIEDGQDDDHPNVKLIQRWVTDHTNRPFKRLDNKRENYGGSKTMCESTYVGVFTGFRVEWLVEYVQSLEWGKDEGVQMLTKGDDDVFFTLTTISGVE